MVGFDLYFIAHSTCIYSLINMIGPQNISYMFY